MLIEKYKVPYGDRDWTEAEAYFYNEKGDQFQLFKISRGEMIKTSGRILDNIARNVGKKRLSTITYINTEKEPMETIATDYYYLTGKKKASTIWNGDKMESIYYNKEKK